MSDSELQSVSIEPTDTSWRTRLDRSLITDLAVVLGAWVVLSIRILWSGVGLDDVVYAVPSQQITLDAWKHGHMALWSSSAFAGTPHLGNMQTAALYPLHWFAAPFNDLLGADIELAVHALILGMGFYLLGRRLRLIRPAPALMAVAGMWTGATVIRVPMLVHFPPLAWAPLGMVAVHAVVTSPRPRKACAALALILWCVLSSGHPQSVLMAFTLLIGWAAALVIEHKAWRRLGQLAASAGLTLLMAAPVLFALRHSMTVAAAGERDEAVVANGAYVMPLRQFPRWLFGEPTEPLIVLYGQGERITYTGLAVVAMALIGLIAALRARRWSYGVLAAVGAGAASLSLGLRSPTLRFARAFLPGFDQPRVSARWNWVLVMVLVVLAGVGIDCVRRRRATKEALAVGAAGFALAASMQFGVQDGGWPDNLFWIITAALVMAVAFVGPHRFRIGLAAVLLCFATYELAMPMKNMIESNDIDITSTSQLDGPAQRYLAGRQGLTLALTNENFEAHYLVQGMRPNANTLFGIRSIDGYDGGVSISRRWHVALKQIIPSVTEYLFRAQVTGELDTAAMARLGVRYVLYDPTRGPPQDVLPGWQLRLDGSFQVWENPLWRGDVTVWYRTALVDTPETAADLLRSDRANYSSTGLVESDSATLPCSGTCEPDWFTSTSGYNGQRSVDIVASASAVVAVAEQYDDGWTVTVDGHERTLVAVDGAWAGVEVSAGPHHIEWTYDPSWLLPSLLLMVAAWLGLAALAFWPRRVAHPEPPALDSSEPTLGDTASEG